VVQVTMDSPNGLKYARQWRRQQGRERGGGAKEKRIFIKLLHMCVYWGGRFLIQPHMLAFF